MNKPALKKLYYAAFAYLVIGLLGGLFYREFTKANDFSGFTQLSVFHTHILTLGVIVLLVVFALEALFTLSKTKWFNLFYWHYNAGLLITTVMMLVHGILTVTNQESSAAIAGIAGLGHIILSAGFVFLFVALHKAIFTQK